MDLYPVKLEGGAYQIFLEVPREKIINLQAFFEIYEGLAAVRTENKTESIVSLLTTESMLEDCLAALRALAPEIPWRDATPVDLR